jgi:hypothetical protein
MFRKLLAVSLVVLSACPLSAGEFQSLAEGIVAMYATARPQPSPSPTPTPNPPSPSQICTNCNGTGRVGDGTVFVTCVPCKGTGKIVAQVVDIQSLPCFCETGGPCQCAADCKCDPVQTLVAAALNSPVKPSILVNKPAQAVAPVKVPAATAKPAPEKDLKAPQAGHWETRCSNGVCTQVWVADSPGSRQTIPYRRGLIFGRRR